MTLVYPMMLGSALGSAATTYQAMYNDMVRWGINPDTILAYQDAGTLPTKYAEARQRLIGYGKNPDTYSVGASVASTGTAGSGSTSGVDIGNTLSNIFGGIVKGLVGEEQKPKAGIPWWVWAGGAAVVGVGAIAIMRRR